MDIRLRVIKIVKLILQIYIELNKHKHNISFLNYNNLNYYISFYYLSNNNILSLGIYLNSNKIKKDINTISEYPVGNQICHKCYGYLPFSCNFQRWDYYERLDLNQQYYRNMYYIIDQVGGSGMDHNKYFDYKLADPDDIVKWNQIINPFFLYYGLCTHENTQLINELISPNTNNDNWYRSRFRNFKNYISVKNRFQSNNFETSILLKIRTHLNQDILNISPSLNSGYEPSISLFHDNYLENRIFSEKNKETCIYLNQCLSMPSANWRRNSSPIIKKGKYRLLYQINCLLYQLQSVYEHFMIDIYYYVVPKQNTVGSMIGSYKNTTLKIMPFIEINLKKKTKESVTLFERNLYKIPLIKLDRSGNNGKTIHGVYGTWVKLTESILENNKLFDGDYFEFTMDTNDYLELDMNIKIEFEVKNMDSELSFIAINKCCYYIKSHFERDKLTNENELSVDDKYGNIITYPNLAVNNWKIKLLAV